MAAMQGKTLRKGRF